MDANTFQQSVNALGFPIVACAVLAWYASKQNSTIVKLSVTMTNALNNNTVAVNKLSEKITCEKR